MVNYLKMAKVSVILTLKEYGWLQRQIARELGIHPNTLDRYLYLSGKDSKLVKAPTASEGSKQIIELTGFGEAIDCNTTSDHSQCVTFCKVIEDKLQDGLSCLRVYQNLRDE